MAIITINKLDAARRQLEAAALLYFNSRDIVAVHALAAAAYEIVETMAQKHGRSTLLQRDLLNLLSADLASEARNAMRSLQNFLKHADRDPDGQFEFDPGFTEVVLLDAMATYAQMTGETPSLFDAFFRWLNVQKPQLFLHEADVQEIFLEGQRAFGSMTRLEFLKKYLSTAVEI